jgi:predicted nucleotidyltransferase
MNRLDQVRSQREAILRLAAKHGARNVRIFGSVVRGEAGPSSDLDVLVDFEPGRSLLDLTGFEIDLEELLGCRVDVVVEGGLSPYLEERILREAVPL